MVLTTVLTAPEETAKTDRAVAKTPEHPRTSSAASPENLCPPATPLAHETRAELGGSVSDAASGILTRDTRACLRVLQSLPRVARRNDAHQGARADIPRVRTLSFHDLCDSLVRMLFKGCSKLIVNLFRNSGTSPDAQKPSASQANTCFGPTGPFIPRSSAVPFVPSSAGPVSHNQALGNAHLLSYSATQFSGLRSTLAGQSYHLGPCLNSFTPRFNGGIFSHLHRTILHLSKTSDYRG